jgi:prepilin-type N-terminal cleavage/methylation domain-containing protein
VKNKKKEKNMKKSKGFTLVELIIVIVIVGILSIVAVPIYRGYTKKAIATEAKALLGSIVTSEKVYYAEFGEYFAIATATGYVKELDVDARSNKYFNDYKVTTAVVSGVKAFSALVTGMTDGASKGISLELIAIEDGQVTTYATGLD